jgi:hypothetical protein
MNQIGPGLPTEDQPRADYRMPRPKVDLGHASILDVLQDEQVTPIFGMAEKFRRGAARKPKGRQVVAG